MGGSSDEEAEQASSVASLLRQIDCVVDDAEDESDFADADVDDKNHGSKMGLTATYVYVFFVIGLVQGILGTSLKTLQVQAKTTESLIGMLAFWRGMGWVFGSVAGGFVMEKRWVGPHHLLTGGCMSLIVLHISIPALVSLRSLSVAFVAIGLAGGLLETTATTLIVWVWRKDVQAQLQKLNLATSAGALLSPLIMEAFLEVGKESYAVSVMASFYALSFLCIPPVIVASALRPPSEPLETEIDTESLSSLSRPRKKIPRRRFQILISMAVFTFFTSGIEISSSTWLDLFGRDFLHLSVAEAGLVLSLFYLGMSTSRFVFSFLSCLLPSNNKALVLLLTVFSASILSMTVAAYIPANLMFLISIFLLGLGLGPLQSLGMALPISSPANYLLAAADVSTVVATSNVGELLTPLVLGAFWSASGPISYVWTTLVMLLLTLVSAFALWIACRKNSSS